MTLHPYLPALIPVPKGVTREDAEKALAALVPACLRCEGHPTAPAECAACVAEVARNRQDARDELIEFIRSDDGTDSGRRMA